MAILDLIKNYIVEKGIVADGDVYYNFNDQDDRNIVILWQYDGIPSDICLRPQMQIMVKNFSMSMAEKIANQIYDILYPVGQFEKMLIINGEALKIVPKQSPFYLEKDDSNRHIYVFNVDIFQKRS